MAHFFTAADTLRSAQANPGMFDDVTDHKHALVGSGIEMPWLKRETARFALYYMWFDKKSSTFAKGAGRQNPRHSWRTRMEASAEVARLRR
jgi:hypothetical protein